MFTSTSTGAPVGGAVVAQDNAITNIIVCNTGTPNLTDETVNSADVNVYVVSPSGGGDNTTISSGSLIVKQLIIPAGETFFFSEERVVLDDNDSIHISCTSGGTITAGSFVAGANYKILTLGTTTNWNTVASTSSQRSWGAGSASVGDTFTATAAGSGDGTAILCLLTATVSSLEV